MESYLISSSVNLLAAGLIFGSGILMLRVVRNGGAVLLVVGGGFLLMHSLASVTWWISNLLGAVWYEALWSSGSMRGLFQFLSFGETFGWVLVAWGMLMVAFFLRSLWGRKQALEAIVEGIRADRPA